MAIPEISGLVEYGLPGFLGAGLLEKFYDAISD
jgi:hypothetical protein